MKRKYADLESQLVKSKETNKTLLQLFDAIKSRPAGDADAIVQRIRAGVAPDSILRHVHAGDLLLQLQVAPESRYRFEFPYRANMPSLLRIASNPYFQSTLFEAASIIPDSKMPTSSVERYRPQYTKPYVAATIVDARLDLVKPSRWTQVIDDDNLMRHLLQQYFLYEYQWFPLFHKDDFLDAMLTGSEEFCSALLVNTVLALACVSIRIHLHPFIHVCRLLMTYANSILIVHMRIVPNSGIHAVSDIVSRERRKGSGSWSAT